MLKPISYLLIIWSIASCSGQPPKSENELGSIDLLPDDKEIIFSTFKNGRSGLWTSHLDHVDATQLLYSKDTIFIGPKFSPDGTRILFIAYQAGSTISNVFVADKNGKNKHQVTFQDQFITEAIFSTNGNRIYVCKANSFKSYSPIGRASFHGFDLFSIDLKTLKETRLTNIAAYEMSDISHVSGNYITMRLMDQKQVGLCIISTLEPNAIKSLTPENNPRGNPDLYYSPSYSTAFNKVAFTAPYELYLMDLETRQAQLVYGPLNEDQGLIENVITFHNEQKILFRKHGETGFRIIHFDGTQLEKVSLQDVVHKF